MTEAEVVFHPEASAEYREAYVWYAQHEPRVADRFEQEVEAAVQRIGEDPQRWPIQNPFSWTGALTTLSAVPRQAPFSPWGRDASVRPPSSPDLRQPAQNMRCLLDFHEGTEVLLHLIPV